MPAEVQAELIKVFVSTLLSLFQLVDPHAYVMSFMLTVMLGQTVWLARGWNPKTLSWVAAGLAALFAFLFDAGAPKTNFVTAMNALKAGGVCGFLYLKMGDRLMKSRPRIKSTSVCVALVILLSVGPVASGGDPPRTYTDQEIADAAAEAEQSPEEYLFWLIEYKMLESKETLETGIKQAEKKQEEAHNALQQEVERAKQTQQELEALKAAAERLLQKGQAQQ